MMGKAINLINQRFGRLIVIKKTDKRGADRSIVWHCKCDCGNECDVTSTNLRGGHTKSCGCLHKERISETHKKIIPKGTKFGQLTVIEQLEKRSNQGTIMWKCKCDCGNECVVNGIYLRNKQIQSCGCMRSQGENKIQEILIQNNIFFEREKTFENCKYIKTGYLAKFDFWVENKYLIEFDGKQHFEIIEYFGGEKEFKIRQEHDKIKNKYCFNNNIPLIRIPYTHLNNLCLEDLLLETSQFILKSEE